MRKESGERLIALQLLDVPATLNVSLIPRSPAQGSSLRAPPMVMGSAIAGTWPEMPHETTGGSEKDGRKLTEPTLWPGSIACEDFAQLLAALPESHPVHLGLPGEDRGFVVEAAQ